MASFNLPSLTTIRGFGQNLPLSSTAYSAAPVSLGVTQQLPQICIPDPANAASSLGTISVSLDENTTVAVVNSTSDPDPCGFFNLDTSTAPTAENPALAPLVESPLTFDPTLGYLVLSGISVGGKLAGNFTIGSAAAASLTGSDLADITNCLGFSKNTSGDDALVTAARSFKTIFSISDILALDPTQTAPVPAACQVLSFGIATDLAMAINLTASSLAPLITTSIGSVLNIYSPINFAPAPSATLSVTAEATDGFRIFVQRVGGASVFSVRKAESTSLGLDGGFGLKITVSETDLNNLVTSVFEQLSGAATGTLSSLLTANAAGTATAQQQTDFQAIVAKLGLTSATTSAVNALSSKLTALQTDLKSKISPVVSAQFTYSWKRITTTSTVARLTVPDAALPKYHADLLGFDLTRIMAAGVANDGVVVDRLLGQSTTELDIGYGFSFGLNNYTFLKSWDSLTEKFVENDSYAQDQSLLRQFAFLGKREYQATLLNSGWANYTELDASTSVPLPNPGISDFAVGLSVGFSWTQANLGSIAPGVADLGVILDIFDTDDVTTALQELTKAGLPNNVTGNAVVSITVPPHALSVLVPILAANYNDNLAPQAMARALPYYSPYPERTNVTTRTKIYAQVWADFLATDPDELDATTVARICNARLQGLTPGVEAVEAQGIVAWTAQAIANMASQTDLHDNVANQFPSFLAALQLTSGNFQTLYPACVGNISGLAAQSYGSRILASLIVLGAYLQPGLLDQMPRTLKFTWPNNSQSNVLSLQQGT